MRKSLKKGMAMLLAAAMVFSTPVAMDATAVKAAATTLPQPVATILKSDAVDLSNAIKTPLETYDNPLKGKDLKDGATISFEYEPTEGAAVRELGTILAMQNVSGTEAPAGRMYITPSSYFGYNADGGIIDWNMKDYASVEKYFKASGKQKITMTFSSDNIVLYVDGVKAYDKETGVKGGTNTLTDYSKVLTFLGSSANKVLLGTGSFWVTADADEANGKVGNIEFYTTALSASQVQALVAGNEEAGLATGVKAASAALSSDGKKINVTCTTEVAVPAEDLIIDVKKNGAHVVSGSAVDFSASISGDGFTTVEGAKVVSGTAVYAYTPTADGTYTFTVTAKERTVKGVKYQETSKTTTALKVKKQGDSYLTDADLFEGFKAEEGSEGLNITWKALNGATVSAKVTGGGKTINLTAPRTVKFSELTAGTKYTVALTATKAGYATKTATADYTYSTKFEAYTVGTIDKKTAFWKAFSKPYQINDKKTRVVEMEVHGGAALYNNFVLAFANQENFDEATRGSAYTEYAAVRTDKWGWGGGDNKSLCGKDIQYVSHSLVSGGKTMKMGDTGFDAAFIAIMDSANATVEVARSGKMLEITMKIASTKNAKNVITSVTRLELGTKDGKDNGTGKVFMRIVPDMSYFIVKNVTEKAAGEIKPPADTDNDTDGGSTAKVSKVSITVPNRKAGKTIYMKKGDKVTLKATVKGDKGCSKSVTWKSSKTKIATVKNGKVTAKKAGTAKITATSKTDKSKKATITIKVSKKAVKNKVLKISPTKKTLKKGKSLTIKIKKITKKTTDKITYKSSKKSVATVDAYGKVKAKKKGKATITVKCGKKSAKLKLTVKK